MAENAELVFFDTFSHESCEVRVFCEELGVHLLLKIHMRYIHCVCVNVVQPTQCRM